MGKLFELTKTKLIVLLTLIILLAGFLRFYNLGTNPPSLNWDETAWGYNAYSIGVDGRDEFGRFLPHDYLESFGDYKPPVYVYLTVLPVKVFGLNEFATRFASAFIGMLTVLLAYFFAKLLFEDSDQKNKKQTYAESIGLLTALLLAISPWHILLSRAAFEENVATFFVVLGAYLFIYAAKKKPYILIFSAMSFILSVYTFNSARIVSPILIVILALLYWKKLWSMKKYIVIAGVVGLLFLLPTLRFLLSSQAKVRYQEVNIFSDISIIQNLNQEVTNDHDASWSKIIHNRRFAYTTDFLEHYFDNLSPNFLFIQGDNNPEFSTGAVGQLYLWELPFLLVGIFFLFKKRESSWLVIPLWLLIGIIPAAITEQTPHALRIENAILPFQILIAYGIVHAVMLTKPRFRNFPLKRSLVVFTVLLASLNFLYFAEDYFVFYPSEFSSEWEYGYKDAVEYMNSVGNQYKYFYLTDLLGRPYIYTLFYTKYNPQLYRSQVKLTRDNFGFVTVNSFGKYYFDMKDLPKAPKGKTLYIDGPKNVPANATIKKRFYLLNGQEVLEAYTL